MSVNILTSSLVALVAVTAALTWFVIKAQLRGVVTGIESLAGKKGLAKSALAPRGTVLSEGELWTAESVSGDIPAGAEVIVESVQGFTIKVRKA